MARSVDEIQAAIIADVQATPELAAASSTSKRAIWRLWTFVVAVAINLLEQLMDIFKSDVEKTVALAAPQTAQWIQDKVFKFQYDVTNPQVIQFINFVPQYPVVDADLQIITRCSVKTTISNVVKIKVAKQSPPIAITTPELNALQSYVNDIGVAGIDYQVESTNADKLYVQAQIFYIGQYSTVISANVIAAIESYLGSIPFDGTLILTDLVDSIKAIEGVNDVVLNNVKARKDSDPLSLATFLVQSNTVIGRLFPTISGYIVGETTAGNTLADTLTFIAE